MPFGELIHHHFQCRRRSIGGLYKAANCYGGAAAEMGLISHCKRVLVLLLSICKESVKYKYCTCESGVVEVAVVVIG